ncbi:4-alpha-glucanotransferase [Bienertia sinuspersici]
MLETDEFISSNSENILSDPISISTAYAKIKNLCISIGREILSDIKIHNEHILPSPIQRGVNCEDLFHNYILVWVQEMQLELLDLCRAEKTPWSGVSANHATSPFADDMYSKIKDALAQYEIVISRWPQYALVLENAVADIERAILKTLGKQYSDILAPLKDSIPKKLGMHVQKLARRQSVTLNLVPSELGTFLNTVKRMVEALHSQIEDILRSWASCLPTVGHKKSSFGEQMNGMTVMLKTKYKNYMQALVAKLYSNMQANRNTQLKRILEETKDSDSEPEVRERMLMLNSQLNDSGSNLHDVFMTQIFVALCRGFWDRLGQRVLRFLEGQKENRILDDTFGSQMQRLQGNVLQEKDIEPPRSVVEARSMLM